MQEDRSSSGESEADMMQTWGLYCSPACSKNGKERRQAHGSVNMAQRENARVREGRFGRVKQKSLTGMKNNKKYIAVNKQRRAKFLGKEHTLIRDSWQPWRCRELVRLRAMGCPSPSTPHALGDTYRAREAVAAVNRRRCPRDPIAPPRHAWMKNIFGLFCRLGQLALSKSRKTSWSWSSLPSTP